MMKAAVIRAAGGLEGSQDREPPDPQPRNDQVLIRIKASDLTGPNSSRAKVIRRTSSFPVFWALKRSGLSRAHRGTNSARVTKCRPPWAVWIGILMAGMPSTLAYPSSMYKRSKPSCPGKPSARYRRCFRPRGVRCSSRCVSKSKSAWKAGGAAASSVGEWRSV
jgi:hypothetical protein